MDHEKQEPGDLKAASGEHAEVLLGELRIPPVRTHRWAGRTPRLDLRLDRGIAAAVGQLVGISDADVHSAPVERLLVHLEPGCGGQDPYEVLAVPALMPVVIQCQRNLRDGRLAWLRTYTPAN
jgi:hypothetical protein